MNTESGNNIENQYSELEWLGSIPKHWKVRRLKFISKVQSSSVDKKSKEDEDEVLLCNYVDVYKNEFIDDSIEFMKATAPQRHIEQFTLNEGDIIITKDSEDRFDIAVPAKVNKDFDNVLCGYHLALIRADYEHIDPDFLFRWFQSDLVNDQFKVSANGITRYGLSVSSIKDSVVAVPPLPEQKAIGTFLDHQTTRIDQLIEKKKRILDLLDEQRQATITRAVTKGINPNANMRDSGIDWLGEVPEHWDLNRLKFVSHVQSSSVDKKSKDDEDDVLLCNYVDVYKNEFIDDSIEFMKATAPQRHIESFTLQEGDIIITKDSEDRFDIAVPAKVNMDFEDVLCGYHLAHIRPNESMMNSDYLFRWFQSDLVNDQFKVAANGITRFGLGLSSIKDSVVALPPLKEQEAIATFIHNLTTKIDRLKSEVNSAIELLTEYRSSLITQAVTGKIDVRNEVSEQELSYAAEEGESYTTN